MHIKDKMTSRDIFGDHEYEQAIEEEVPVSEEPEQNVPSMRRRRCKLTSEGTRKIAVLIDVRKLVAKGQRLFVDLGINDQPIGEPGNLLLSYCGILGRELVPLTCLNWRRVSQDHKDRIWREIVAYFDVEERMRAECMKRVGEGARMFRSDLHVTFIKDQPDDDEVRKLPREIQKYYTEITPEAWKEFVDYKISEKGKEASARGQ